MATSSCSGLLGTCKIISKNRINFQWKRNNLNFGFSFQLEVLELLVQNGADLNAKNKHDETPAGKIYCFQYKIIIIVNLLNYC